ncbi:MAG TPA: DUF6194 family protein [Anaerolineales bacterium]|nr:DUF6194 family protein [Anaerolineales bacterium]
MSESPITESVIEDYINRTFDGVETAVNLGYTFFFYRSDHMLPFATIASTGNEYERISDLDRPGVFRLNIGVSRSTFESMFGAGKVDLGSYDFTALDVIMPHPDYSNQHFICVLSPGAATFEHIRPMLAEAYDIAARRNARRSKQT